MSMSKDRQARDKFHVDTLNGPISILNDVGGAIAKENQAETNHVERLTRTERLPSISTIFKSVDDKSRRIQPTTLQQQPPDSSLSAPMPQRQLYPRYQGQPYPNPQIASILGTSIDNSNSRWNNPSNVHHIHQNTSKPLAISQKTSRSPTHQQSKFIPAYHKSSSSQPSTTKLQQRNAETTSTSSTDSNDKSRYPCEDQFCSKTFSSRAHLVRHMKIHRGIRNYKCNIPGCNRDFTRHDNMVQHYRRHIVRFNRENEIPVNNFSQGTVSYADGSGGYDNFTDQTSMRY